MVVLATCFLPLLPWQVHMSSAEKDTITQQPTGDPAHPLPQYRGEGAGSKCTHLIHWDCVSTRIQTQLSESKRQREKQRRWKHPFGSFFKNDPLFTSFRLKDLPSIHLFIHPLEKNQSELRWQASRWSWQHYSCLCWA